MSHGTWEHGVQAGLCNTKNMHTDTHKHTHTHTHTRTHTHNHTHTHTLDTQRMNSRRSSFIAPLCRIIYSSDYSCVYIFLAESCAAVDSSAGRSSKAQNICIRICIRIYVCIYKCTFVCTAKAWKKTRRGKIWKQFFRDQASLSSWRQQVYTYADSMY